MGGKQAPQPGVGTIEALGGIIGLIGLLGMLVGGVAAFTPIRFFGIRSGKQGWLVLGGGLVLVVIGGGIIPEEEEQAEPLAEAEPAEPMPEPTPADTATTLRNAFADALGSSNRERTRVGPVEYDGSGVTVQWAINDNLTEGFVKRSAQMDVEKILKALDESGAPFDSVTVRGTFSMVDQYGNASETEVVRVTYTRQTVDRINWERFLTDNVYPIAERVQLHPVFR